MPQKLHSYKMLINHLVDSTPYYVGDDVRDGSEGYGPPLYNTFFPRRNGDDVWVGCGYVVVYQWLRRVWTLDLRVITEPLKE